MSKIESVVVIYNPNSTGSARDDAVSFCKQVREKAAISARAVPTKHAGHAKTLARQYAERATPTMVVSASGDGGYNEVINGVLGSKHPSTITGVLPSGNANDHYHFIHHGDTIKRIMHDKYDTIDVLQIRYGNKRRYAHSYIGLGLTPQIGERLTEERPNRLQEIVLVIKNLFKVRPVKIRANKRVRRYDHLVFSNTGRMSKVLHVADHGTVRDGKFEVIGTRAGSAATLLSHLFHAASFGAKAHERTGRFSFTAIRAMKAQLDGEIINIPKDCVVTVTCEKQLLRTIV